MISSILDSNKQQLESKSPLKNLLVSDTQQNKNSLSCCKCSIFFSTIRTLSHMNSCIINHHFKSNVLRDSIILFINSILNSITSSIINSIINLIPNSIIHLIINLVPNSFINLISKSILGSIPNSILGFRFDHPFRDSRRNKANHHRNWPVVFRHICHQIYHGFNFGEKYQHHSGETTNQLSQRFNVKRNTITPFRLPKLPKSFDKKETEKIMLSNILVINLCIEQYDGDKYHNFQYSHYDKSHMIDTFVNKYNYDMICNKKKSCTRKEMDDIIATAQSQFGNDKNNYQGIIVVFSGHGNKNSLICSDDYIYDRLEFTKAFNGSKIVNKTGAIKLFFIDACKGEQDANSVQSYQNMHIGAEIKGFGKKSYHPDAQTTIYSPNTDGLSTYSEPNTGGILVNALHETMTNHNQNMVQSLIEIENSLNEKINDRNINVLNGDGSITQHPVLLVKEDRGFNFHDKNNIYFGRNLVPNSQRYFQRYCKRNVDDLSDQNIEYK